MSWINPNSFPTVLEGLNISIAFNSRSRSGSSCLLDVRSSVLASHSRSDYSSLAGTRKSRTERAQWGLLLFAWVMCCFSSVHWFSL